MQTLRPAIAVDNQISQESTNIVMNQPKQPIVAGKREAMDDPQYAINPWILMK